MWPHEHLAVGYLAYSLLVRLGGRRPGDGATLALALATQFPDLVDKPLAWWLGVLPSGRSLGHSAFAAGAVVVLVVVLGRARGQTRPELAVAVAVGYATHLVGDLGYPLLVGGRPAPGFLLWPLVPARGGVTDGTAHLVALATGYAALLGDWLGITYLAVGACLVVGAVLLWIADGTPGPSLLFRWCRRRADPREGAR